jgi:LuxR family transcriptional regulator, quorum-sensing system regulator LasR
MQPERTDVSLELLQSRNLIEQMSPLLDAPDESTWFDAISNLAEKWGFNQVFVAILVRPDGQFEDAFIRSTYAPSWRRTYDDRKLSYIDPIVSHCSTRSSPIAWSQELFDTAPTPQQAFFEEARSHGLRVGVTLPIHGPKQEWGGLSFVTDRTPTNDFWRHIDTVLPDLMLLRDLVIDTSQRHLNAHMQPLIPQPTPRGRGYLARNQN